MKIQFGIFFLPNSSTCQFLKTISQIYSSYVLFILFFWYQKITLRMHKLELWLAFSVKLHQGLKSSHVCLFENFRPMVKFFWVDLVGGYLILLLFETGVEQRQLLVLRLGVGQQLLRKSHFAQRIPHQYNWDPIEKGVMELETQTKKIMQEEDFIFGIQSILMLKK